MFFCIYNSDNLLRVVITIGEYVHLTYSFTMKITNFKAKRLLKF